MGNMSSGDGVMAAKVLAMAWNKQWEELRGVLLGMEDHGEWRLRANNGMSALMLAVEAGEWQVGKEMLRLGADANDADANGQSVLHVAACEGQVEAVRGLLKLGANPNGEDMDGVTPLMEACMGWEKSGGQLAAAKELIKVGAQVNARAKAGEGALFYACGAESEELVALLLEAGASIESQERLWLPLVACAKRGMGNACKSLIARGAKVREKTRRGLDAASAARDSGHGDLATWLATMD